MSKTCYILNQTGHTLSSVFVGKGVVTGIASINGESFTDGETFAQTMNLNAVISFDFQSGDDGDDLWTLSFSLENGTTYSALRKQCNVSADDLASPAGIYINLLSPEVGFSIETPVSSGCTDNSYSEGPLT